MIVFNHATKIFSSPLINNSNYFSGFSTKQLGDSRKIENVVNFLKGNQINYKTVVCLEQIHSANVYEFSKENPMELEKIEETDGIITKKRNAVLVVKTGDCVPIIFIDKENGIIGISHQGWRGTIKRLQQKMITRTVEIGSVTNNIKVAIGPSIGACCYEVQDDTYYSFLEEFDGFSDKIFYIRHGKRLLNLPLLNYLLLLEKGVKKENIDFFPFCTKCDKKRFFSFRRDKKQNYGEMFSFVMKK